MAPRAAGPHTGYRVLCYELRGDREVPVVDENGAGFVAPVGTIDDGILHGDLWSGGPQELQAHLALAIADDEQLSR
jgi:hypothetical protein